MQSNRKHREKVHSMQEYVYYNGSNCKMALLFAGKKVFFIEKVRYLWKTLLSYSRGLCLPVYLFTRSLVFGDALPPLLLLLILVPFLMVLFVITGNGCTEMNIYLLNFNRTQKATTVTTYINKPYVQIYFPFIKLKFRQD